MIDLAYVRHFRIGTYTIFDSVLAYVGVFFISPWLRVLAAKAHVNISRGGWIWLTLPISVVFHLLFHQKTPFMNMLFNPDTFYLEAIVVVYMLYMGLRNVRSPISHMD